MRLYVDKKEVPILVEALEKFISDHPQDRQLAEKLLDKIQDCKSLQIAQHPRSDA